MKRRTSELVTLCAYHEAAHAVVAYKVFQDKTSFPVMHLTIKADGDSGGHCSIYDDLGVDNRYYLAGMVAELLISIALHKDQQKAVETAYSHAYGDTKNMSKLELDTQLMATAEIVSSNWPIIEKLAAKLRKNRYVGATGVYRILSGCLYGSSKVLLD
jgi:hypothetical protein